MELECTRRQKKFDKPTVEKMTMTVVTLTLIGQHTFASGEFRTHQIIYVLNIQHSLLSMRYQDAVLHISLIAICVEGKPGAGPRLRPTNQKPKSSKPIIEWLQIKKNKVRSTEANKIGC